MTPIQVFQFANIMGFYLNEDKQLVRDALLYVPESSTRRHPSHPSLYGTCYSGTLTRKLIPPPNSYEQAQICFREIKAVLKGLDPKFKELQIEP